MLEDIYSYLWYLKTMKATVLACLFAFVWIKSTAANSFLKIFSFSQYLVLAIWEMFMICYSAEIIFLNSQRCDEALQRSPWHLHACEIKKDILFFILNAQQPFRLTGGKMFNLNVEKFRRAVPLTEQEKSLHDERNPNAGYETIEDSFKIRSPS
ncbi:unnamed protein product [Ceratitis capitata]|uniref:(Mediterranean fruit fly) hypothetical protein n=1 Tax=Ceratitis capitata TaxID=7213 RepID=A0A811UCQ3_CERCA|nr:unnamed protein product [Ceratitis capitata]